MQTPNASATPCHWGIENGLHWVMDMVFRDDECRIRKQNDPANFATIKHMASNLLRRAPGKDSLRVKRKLMGRHLPRRPHHRVKPFTRFP